MPAQYLRLVLFVLFSVSGFTGLIYESIWSHYLKLFLGHAAYAQALVLAIFMGGMALGAWLASHLSSRLSNLLLIYAIVEAVIGFLGIVFHPLFLTILDISFNTVIPSLDTAASAQFYKWSVGILLILPQSILLGMTFPLMSNGIIRRFPDTPGRTLSVLYFTNSIGAAVGVLIAGFVLIAAVGLPGTILFAGIINVLLAVIVYGLAKNTGKVFIPVKTNSGLPRISKLLLIAAFITGMASFIYEVAWIRMLSMVLGASTHSFELMLSAFITGLAFGGLWIKKYIDNFADPLFFAGLIQIVMGLCALATVPLYNYTYDLMGYFLSAIKYTDAGYNLFTLASHLIAFLVMLPATFCAGMTLPLFTKILMQQSYGEKSVGQIYASNTLGAIVGVIFTIYIAMPFFGLKNTIITGSGLDIFLGIVLLLNCNRHLVRSLQYTVIAFLILFIFVATTVTFDYKRMSSSVYRTGRSIKDNDHALLFHKDGKTSTVHVTRRSDGLLTISTNGKPDAAINMVDDDRIGPDETTMVLLSTLAVAIKPDAKTAANIGMGSGLSTHSLLAWPGIELVDTIEIESAMVEGAKLFRPRVERAFSDSRSNIYIDDAKTFFSNHNKKYDLILSEPSNPWVSGTSSLFTDEFYNQTKKYLNKNGLFVQWLQTYEISLELVFTVLNSVDKNYRHYVLYAANDGDLFIIANDDMPVSVPDDIIFTNKNMAHELSLVEISNIQDITARFITSEKFIRPYLNITKPVINSDYFPILDLNATRSRFMQQNAYELTRLRLDPIPLVNILEPDYENPDTTQVNKGHIFSTTEKIVTAKKIYDYVISEKVVSDDIDYTDIELLIRYSDQCNENINMNLWFEKMFSIASMTIPYLTTSELNEMWDLLEFKCPVNISENHKIWLALFRALSWRDAELIADNAIILLNNGAANNNEQNKFLFGSLLLALVKLGEYDAALKLWSQFSDSSFDSEFLPLSLLILYGLSIEGAKNNLIQTAD